MVNPARSASSSPRTPWRLPRTAARPLRTVAGLLKVAPGVPGVPGVPIEPGVSDEGVADEDRSGDGPVTPPMPTWSLETSLFLISAAEARVPAAPSVNVA